MASMNPFKPTAGKMPPAIIGRDGIVDEFIEGIENGAGAPGRLMRISGVHGTGKTVFLGEAAKIAESYGWQVIDEVASEGLCKRILDCLARNRVRKASLEPMALGVSLGRVEVDLAGPTIREAMEDAIAHNGNGLLITLDEVQDAALDELRVLATTIQQVIGDDLDIAFVFAGLPSMIENVINGKTLTFLRRAVPFELKPINIPEVAASLKETVTESGMLISPETAHYLAEASCGYPFLIQLVGYYAWQRAKRKGLAVVDDDVAHSGVDIALARFDATVIEPALQRVSDLGIAYLMAMALDDGPVSSTAEICKRLGKSAQQLSSLRASLIRDSLVEAPSRGKIRFAIPYMANYLNNHREELQSHLSQ